MTRENNFKDAVKLFNDGFLDKALNSFNRLLEDFPGNPLVYHYIGRIHLIFKNYQIASSFLKIAYENSDLDKTSGYYYGRSLLFTKHYKYSIKILLNVNEHIPHANMFLSLAYYYIGEYEKAGWYLDKTPQELKNKKQFINLFYNILYNTGLKLFSEGKLNESAAFFDRAVKLSYHSEKALTQLGFIYLEMKNYEKSISIFEKLNQNGTNEIITIALSYLYNITDRTSKLENLLKNQSESLNITYTQEQLSNILSYTLIRNRKYKEAIPILLRLYRRNFYDEMLLYMIAVSRAETGSFNKALNAYKMIYTITDKNIMINNSFVLFLINNNMFEDALNYSSKFIKNKIYNDKTVLLNYYAGIFNNELSCFEKYFKYLESKFSDNPLFLEAAGKYFKENINDIDHATYYYYKLYNILPNDPHTINSLVDLFVCREMKHQAVYYLSQIYEKQPDNQTVIYYYSYFLIRTSNIEKAVEILKTSTDSYSKYYLLSHAYSLINNKEESLSMLRKSFDLNPLFQPVLFKLLLIFYKTSRVKKALKICRLIEHGNPDFSRVEIYRALLYMRQKRFDLAVLSVKAYSKKISTPLPPYIRMLTFISLYYDGKTEKTIKLLSDEIRKYGKKPSLLVLLALCFKRKYAVTELKKTEKQLLTLFPDSPLFLEYKKRHIDMNSEQFKRNDLGLRILNLIKPQSL